MKKRILLQHTLLSGSGRAQTPRTGDHCPASGWWAPLNDEENPHFITEGSIMPSVNGTAMNWKLTVRQPRRAHTPSHDFPPRGFALDSI
jgi:hypothetical protein